MKSFSQRRVNDRLETVRVATLNAAKPAMQATLKPSGYGPAKITAGNGLYNTAAGAVGDSAVKLGEQKIATQSVEAAAKVVSHRYQGLATVARALYLDDEGTLTLLSLDNPMPSARVELKAAATKLFNTTAYTPAMRAAFAEHNWDSANLSEARGKISELNTALENQAEAKSGYQQAKEAEAAALKVMDQWMARFIKIAREAFAENKQALEQLKIVARSGPTKAQRAGRRKAAETRRAKKQAGGNKRAA